MTAGFRPSEDTATSRPSTPTSHYNGEHSPPVADVGPGSPTHSRQTGSYIFGASALAEAAAPALAGRSDGCFLGSAKHSTER